LEAWFTLLIELLWDKARILEMYLNIAEFGPGQFGVEAASQAWFGKSSGNLTRSQAARLAAVLPNPYVYKAEPPSPYVARRAAWIERQMRALGSPLLAQIEDR
ncbi:MAG: transglycosylase domain-containing protein, partial [Gammaproteobacteria bacterium]|nr:transglycosylase domain-containing protein [Gammaproteobacteria bacterium]